MDQKSRGRRCVELAMEKARLIHEAYAEYDAKGETPELSTVLANIKEKQETTAVPLDKEIDDDSDDEYNPTAADDDNSASDSENGSTRTEVPEEDISLEREVAITSTVIADYSSANVPQFENGTNQVAQKPSDVENKPEDEIYEPTETKKKLTTATDKELRDRKNHPMKETCLRKCKNKKCSEISEDDRKIIWNEFWKLPYTSRRQWLCRNVKIGQVKRRTVVPKNTEDPQNQNGQDDAEKEEEAIKSTSTFRKNESREYFLPKPTLDYKQVKVCKRMLLNTLGYTNDSVLTELSNAIKKTAIGETVGENRGRSVPANKVDRDTIIAHIESFNPSISHYRRYNSPNCRYLSRDLTVQIMYEDFDAKYPGYCKVETYRRTLKSMNISLKMPRGDPCAECLLYQSAVEDGKRSSKAIEPDIVAKQELHELRASQSKTLYQHDKNRNQNPNERIYSMDLQKVILLPIMPHIKDSFFISRLVVYNETYAVLNSKTSLYDSICVLWHEALQGRNADSVVDTIFSVIKMENRATSFIFWADKCTSQNKNWIIYSALSNIVNQPSGPETVIIRYLTKGHTHMSADAVHGNIEKAIQAAGNVDNFDHFTSIVQNSRKKNLVVERQDIFREWKSKKRINRKKQPENTATAADADTSSVLLHDIVEAKFVKGNRELFYKTDFESDYKKLNFLQVKFNPTNALPRLREPYRGINAEKKARIVMELVPKIKNENRRAFWVNLPESDQSRDLLNVEKTFPAVL